jgi:hypothetical protein
LGLDVCTAQKGAFARDGHLHQSRIDQQRKKLRRVLEGVGHGVNLEIVLWLTL